MANKKQKNNKKLTLSSFKQKSKRDLFKNTTCGFRESSNTESADRTWERNNTRQKVNSECISNIAKDAGNIKNLCFSAVVDVLAELLMFLHMISMF